MKKLLLIIGLIAGLAGASQTYNADVFNVRKYIGTPDSAKLKFRIKNTEAGVISPSGQTSIGYGTIKYQHTNNFFNNNTVIGYKALSENKRVECEEGECDSSYSYNNTVIGYEAMDSSLGGSENVAVGHQAMQNGIISGSVAIGARAMQKGSSNSVAIGRNAMLNGGFTSIAIGYSAIGNAGSAQSGSLAIGNYALDSTQTGGNIAIGGSAMAHSKTNTDNIAIGNSAMSYSDGNGGNIGIGSSALWLNQGAYNTAVGKFAMLYNTTGEQNAAFGTNALTNNTTGIKNACFGAAAGEQLTTGGYNTLSGMDAGFTLTVGAGNVAIGWNALASALNTRDTMSVAIGYWTAKGVNFGRYNVWLGAWSGSVAGQEDTVKYSTAIGYGSYTTKDSSVSIGADFVKETHINGKVGVGTRNPAYNLDVIGVISSSSIVKSRNIIWTDSVKNNVDFSITPGVAYEVIGVTDTRNIHFVGGNSGEVVELWLHAFDGGDITITGDVTDVDDSAITSLAPGYYTFRWFSDGGFWILKTWRNL